MNNELTFREKLNIRHIIGFFKHRFYTPIIYSYDKFSDFKRGVHTQAQIDQTDLGFNSLLGNHYEAARYRPLRKVFKLAKKMGYSALLDIGCGYGRPLIVAKEVGFSELYGVDISQRLIDKCETNLDKLNISADIMCCDVDNYSIPDVDLVVFMFNSLKEEKLSLLIEKLKKRQNKCLFIYGNPKYKYLFPSEQIYTYRQSHFGMYEEETTFFEFN